MEWEGVLALIALMWTMYQQYAISKMCAKCPFRTAEVDKLKVLDIGE